MCLLLAASSQNMANPEGEVSEIRDSGITSSSCSKKMFKRIDKERIDQYCGWLFSLDDQNNFGYSFIIYVISFTSIFSW